MLRGILFWSGVIGVFGFLTKFILDLGINKAVYSHKPGPCGHVSGIFNGSEDLALLKSGHVLISNGLSFDRSAPMPEGGIFLMDLSAPEPTPSALKMTIIPSSTFDKEKFHPAGISVFEGSDRTFLFTASLRDQQVDAFEVSIVEKSLKHLGTIRDPLFHAVDDLVLISPKSFYVTNFHRFENFFFFEIALKLPLGSVVFYDGEKAKEVLTGLKGPNGIALSPDGKFLYLALNLAEEFRIYEIFADFSLKLRETFFLRSGPDNLNVDDEGAIWVGAHPIGYQVFQHLLDPKNFAPSQILKISLKKKNSGKFSGNSELNPENFPEITEIFADSGKMIKAATAAVRYKDRLLIGSIIDRLVLCRLKCFD